RRSTLPPSRVSSTFSDGGVTPPDPLGDPTLTPLAHRWPRNEFAARPMGYQRIAGSSHSSPTFRDLGQTGNLSPADGLQLVRHRFDERGYHDGPQSRKSDIL